VQLGKIYHHKERAQGILHKMIPEPQQIFARAGGGPAPRLRLGTGMAGEAAAKVKCLDLWWCYTSFMYLDACMAFKLKIAWP